MTVKELMALLRMQDQDLPVIVCIRGTRYNEDSKREVANVWPCHEGEDVAHIEIQG